MTVEIRIPQQASMSASPSQLQRIRSEIQHIQGTRPPMARIGLTIWLSNTTLLLFLPTISHMEELPSTQRLWHHICQLYLRWLSKLRMNGFQLTLPKIQWQPGAQATHFLLSSMESMTSGTRGGRTTRRWTMQSSLSIEALSTNSIKLELAISLSWMSRQLTDLRWRWQIQAWIKQQSTWILWPGIMLLWRWRGVWKQPTQMSIFSPSIRSSSSLKFWKTLRVIHRLPCIRMWLVIVRHTQSEYILEGCFCDLG